MTHRLSQVYLHIVFSTKNRMPWITPETEAFLYPCLARIASSYKAATLAINGTHDHVHLLQRLHVDVRITKLIGNMKARSTPKLKHRGIANFSWQPGYGVFSLSKRDIDPVTRYIQRQKEHHHQRSFDQEMEHFAQAWGCEWFPDD